MEEVTIYKFQLEVIQEALRIVANVYGCRNKVTCLDRQVAKAEAYSKNALNGEINKVVKYITIE